MSLPRPKIRRWFQYRADRGRGEPITGPPGTTRPFGGQLLAYCDDTSFTTMEELEALTVAALATDKRQIVLVGPSAHTTRVKAALYGVWDTTRPPDPRKPRTAPAVTGPVPRCGRPRKSDGQPCQQPAGWGSDDPNGPCRNHGGQTVERAREVEELADACLAYAKHLGKPRDQTPTIEEQLVTLRALRVIVGSRKPRRQRVAAERPSPCAENPDPSAPSTGPEAG